MREGARVWLNHVLGRFGLRVWIIGEGRSGTTWLSTLVDPTRRMRHLFEPFHPHRTPELRGAFTPYLYLRPGASHHVLEEVSERVFTGRHHSERTSAGSTRLLYDGLLVKDIFANLLAPWVHLRHPEVRTVLLIRHPFEVARSKMSLDDWYWFREPMELLHQHELMTDHLRPFEKVVGEAQTQFQKYVALWCISTLVPLRSFPPDRIKVVFYEALRTDLEGTLDDLYRYLRLPLPDMQVLQRVAAQPSRTSRSGDGQRVVSTLTDGPTVPEDDMRRGLHILREFGLDALYGPDGMPRPNVASELSARP